jgi:hypothetical protein
MRKPLLLLVQDTPSVNLTVVLVRFTGTGLLLIDKGIDLKASGERSIGSHINAIRGVWSNKVRVTS